MLYNINCNKRIIKEDKYMASVYDRISSASELIYAVRFGGLSTAQEDINRAQDIFGNTSLGELIKLANDRGRNNNKGDPDPQGSWSSGRVGTQQTFYSILFTIWNWQDALNFYNMYSNQQYQTGQQAICLSEKLRAENDSLRISLDETDNDLIECSRSLHTLEERVAQADQEIIKLKASLYDAMCK